MKNPAESVSTEKFLILCKEAGLTHDDLEHMTFGMALDYIDEYFEMKNPNKKPKTVNAGQSDFDKF
ncbi:hypothetical protein MKX73_19660 [Solibacillus sp. FSL W7-1436]|uniref:hypothetical protein n=1 Tax=Solibacillus sp. FSL W7-1436 TaxID=2921705 RepID=UPI0030F880E1